MKWENHWKWSASAMGGAIEASAQFRPSPPPFVASHPRIRVLPAARENTRIDQHKLSHAEAIAPRIACRRRARRDAAILVLTLNAQREIVASVIAYRTNGR